MEICVQAVAKASGLLLTDMCKIWYLWLRLQEKRNKGFYGYILGIAINIIALMLAPLLF
jgi:hypothetical protein